MSVGFPLIYPRPLFSSGSLQIFPSFCCTGFPCILKLRVSMMLSMKPRWHKAKSISQLSKVQIRALHFYKSPTLVGKQLLLTLKLFRFLLVSEKLQCRRSGCNEYFQKIGDTCILICDWVLPPEASVGLFLLVSAGSCSCSFTPSIWLFDCVLLIVRKISRGYTQQFLPTEDLWLLLPDISARSTLEHMWCEPGRQIWAKGQPVTGNSQGTLFSFPCSVLSTLFRTSSLQSSGSPFPEFVLWWDLSPY